MFLKMEGIGEINFIYSILHVIEWRGEPFLKLIVLDHLKGDAVTPRFPAILLNRTSHLASDYKLPSTGTHHIQFTCNAEYEVVLKLAYRRIDVKMMLSVGIIACHRADFFDVVAELNTSETCTKHTLLSYDFNV